MQASAKLGTVRWVHSVSRVPQPPAGNSPSNEEGCMAQILIVDDSRALRSSIRTCIEQDTDWKVCGEAENGQVAIEKVMELQPDLVVLDLAMPVMNGLDAAREITNIAPKLAMVLFTIYVSGGLETEAKAVGIGDVVSKAEGGTEQLLASMRSLLERVGIH
jgi:DNA-binding NarL/FixJ family response regulator